MPAFCEVRIRRHCRIFVVVWMACLAFCGCQGSDVSGPASTAPSIDLATGTGRIPQVDSTADASAKKKLPRESRAGDLFVDCADDLGIRFTYQNGREGLKFTILETIGGGVATFDFDGDDELEVFCTGGGTFEGSPIVVRGHPCALFRIAANLDYREVAASAGVASATTYTLGCSVCDYNCDGCPDLFLTGFPRCHLYRNHGDGTFDEVTEASEMSLAGLHAASTWGDFDGDGLPDLFVTGYVKYDLREDRDCGDKQRHLRDVCGIWQYLPAPDQLFRNLGNGTFEEITHFARLRADGRGLGAIAVDINADGRLDLYVANDYTPNFLYLGDGQGRFNECGLISGTALDGNGAPQGSMGVDFGDYDGDGRGDLFVTNYQFDDSILYRNLGDASFDVMTSRVGLQDICRPFVGFGTGWFDWDSDGWLDLFVLNGHVMYHKGENMYEQPQFLFRNINGRHFENASDRGGPYFSVPRVGRGGAVGDLNNDGAPDLVAVHHNTPVSVLINQKPPLKWISVCLRGITSEPFATGAVVTSEYSGRQLTRHVRSGAGYFSHFDRRILLPVDADGAGQCSVRWLNGRSERFNNLQTGRTNQLIEGHGERL